MASYNKVIILGNLTRDPEVKYTPKGKAVAQISLAVNHNYKTESGEKREEVTFVDVTLWGRVAEIVEEYAKKGKPLLVEGRLKLDQWEDKETGKKRSKLTVVGENIQLLGSKGDSSDKDDDEPPRRQQERAATRPPKPPRDPDLDVPEDDIPF